MAAKQNVPAEQAEKDFARHPVLQEAEVKQAGKAWRTLKDNAVRDLKHWWNVGNGLLTVYNRLEADNGGKAPSRKDFGKALEAAGLSDIPQETRSAAMKLHQEFDSLEEAQGFLKEIGSSAANPEAVQKALRSWRKQAEQPQAQVEDQRDPGNTVEDAEYADANESDGGPAPVDAQEEAPEPSNREARQTSGSSPWWMIQVEKISGLPDSITDIDPDALVSAAKGSDPCEKELTKERVQRIRQRAQEIVEFCDAWERERE
jgi:hypothetical protein